MSGHSKWASIKHKKGKEDARRGKIFTKLIKEITIAARIGGGDQQGNPRLRTAVQTAKDNNMPAENITRAIKKGIGALPGQSFEEITYEGYGPGGVAVLVDVMTDNRNRATAEVRFLFSKSGGNLGETNCVNWIFSRKGVLEFELGDKHEEELLEIALENDAEDLKVSGDMVEVITSVENMEAVKEVFEAQGVTDIEAEITMIPSTTVQLDGKKAEQMLRLMEKLEDLEDVREVYANFDIDDELMDQLSND